MGHIVDKRITDRASTDDAILYSIQDVVMRGRMVNLSADGCMIADQMATPEQGSKVEITLLEGVTVSGEVAWATDGSFGVTFSRPLSEVTIRYFKLAQIDFPTGREHLTDQFGRGLPPMEDTRRFS